MNTRRRSEEFQTLVEGDAGRVGSAYADLLDVVAALRAVPRPEADPAFVASLRERIVLEAEEVLAAAASAYDDEQARLAIRHPSPRVQRRHRRVAAVVAGAVLVGGSATMAVASQSALPGDSLYPLKRGIENVHAELTFDRADRGRLLLGDASTRLDEVAELDHESGGAAQVGPTLDAFAQQATEGSQLLVEDYQQTGNRSSITSVRQFTASSMARLAELQSVVPTDSLDSLLQAAQAVAQIQRTAQQSCPSCTGPDVTKVPEVLTTSMQEAADSWHLGTPAGPAAQASSTPRLPHLGNNVPPASVTDPTQPQDPGGRSGTASPPSGDVRHTLQHLTSGLTGGHQHDLGSTVTDTTGNLLDAVGQAGDTVGGALGGSLGNSSGNSSGDTLGNTVGGVTSGVPSVLPSLP